MTKISNGKNLVALLVAGLLASACGSTPEVEGNFDPTVIRGPVVAAPTTGSIYVSGTDVRLFEDIRAGRVGDILTVRLAENTNASKNSNTVNIQIDNGDAHQPGHIRATRHGRWHTHF